MKCCINTLFRQSMEVIMTEQKQAPDFSTLAEVMRHWEVKGITSWEDVEAVGEDNVQRLISLVRRLEKIQTEEIKWMHRKAALLTLDYSEEAKKYANPSVHVVHKSGVLQEPVDYESLIREEGSTTFNLCWWCHHFNDREKGSAAETIKRKGECSIFYYAGAGSMTCGLSGYKREIEDLLEKKTEEIQEIREKRVNTRTTIRWLEEIKRNSSFGRGGVPPSLRRNDYLVEGDVVWHCCKSWTLHSGKWIRGRLFKEVGEEGLTFHMCTEVKFHENSYLSGYGGSGDLKDATFLSHEDFRILQHLAEIRAADDTQHDDEDVRFFKIWVASIEDSEGASQEGIVETLRSPRWVREKAG